MKTAYLVLAVLGGILPYLFFFPFFQLEGIDLSLFVESLFVNGPAGGFSSDLLFTSFVFWLYMSVQVQESNGPKPYLFIFINLVIGLSCALPAYLYVVKRRGEAQAV